MSDKLRVAALAVLESTKSLFVCCSDFSHLPQDLHPDGKCIPWGRYNDALTALEAALAEQKPMLEINPQKREWVGLTDEEINLIYDRPHIYFTQYAKDIEAKLRQKNT